MSFLTLYNIYDMQLRHSFCQSWNGISKIIRVIVWYLSDTIMDYSVILDPQILFIFILFWRFHSWNQINKIDILQYLKQYLL
jgi:hypothetical protein